MIAFSAEHITANLKDEVNPEAVRQWYEIALDRGYRGDPRKSEIKDEAMGHLWATGWLFWYIQKGKAKYELRYTSPEGKIFISLRTACKGCMDLEAGGVAVSPKRNGGKQGNEAKSTETDDPESEWGFLFRENSVPMIPTQRKRKDGVESAGLHPAVERSRGKQGNESELKGEFAGEEPIRKGKPRGRPPKRPKIDYRYNHPPQKLSDPEPKIYSDPKFVPAGDSISQEETPEFSRRVKQFGVKVRKESPLTDHHRNPRTIVSYLIDNQVVRNMEKVQYLGKSIEGRITRKGIQCDCCFNTFTLPQFAAHSGSTNYPAADIILEESGMSLFDCQQLVVQNQKTLIPKLHTRKNEFSGFENLIGKQIQLRGNLTWTIIKSMEDSDSPHSEAENHIKLSIALDILHECFEESEKKFDFRRFCFVTLEENGEMVSVAAVRVYGKKVAEIALVGTRFMFRGNGMCRILMNVLEEQVRGLGVERMVLPAVPGVAVAWIDKFGFLKMTKGERLMLLDYTLRNFQGVEMYWKELNKSSEGNGDFFQFL